jgi:hypothetical protein
MAVEDPDPIPNDPGRTTDHDLFRKVADQADVVISQNQFDVQSVGKKVREEPENDRSQMRWGSDDRVLRVPRDQYAAGALVPREVDEIVRETLGRALRGTGRRLGARPQPEMEVGYEHGPRPRIPVRIQEECRGIRNRL